MGGALKVGLVLDQFLDAQQDLLDGDEGLPVLLLVEDGQAHCAGGVDIGMGQDRLEYTFGGSNWIVVGEVHVQHVGALLPDGACRARYLADPF